MYQSWGKPEAAIKLFTDISLAESPYAENINEALGIIIIFSFIKNLFIFFYIFFYYRLLQDIEYSSLCYTIGLY